MNLDTYLKQPAITQDSERLLVRDFMYPLIGTEGLDFLKPQYPYIDTFGRNRRIDFAIIKDSAKIAIEVDGESYHAEGAVSSKYFDESLQRQDDIVLSDWIIMRYSYTQLQSSKWREYVMDTLKEVLRKYCPSILIPAKVEANPLQENVLKRLANARNHGIKKGIVVMPTGTGKTYLAALDAKSFGAKKVLYLAHKREILKQAKKSFTNIFSNARFGVLNGAEKTDVANSDILFASKDTLTQEIWMKQFKKDYFDYIIVDEVHHSVAKSYNAILNWFTPKFWLGLTATPERMDQKDILGLFDYNLIASFDLNDAIENGFLVAYKYYGLTDDIDYSNIKYNGSKYDVHDLDQKLNIPKRNQAILQKYEELLQGDKTIGFAINKKHADNLAKLFNENGFKAISIHSGTKDVDKKIIDFKNNQYNIVFTVDMFNEGVDIPNVRGLMFLRPTESKTIFLQQLGRGLRLAPSKKSIVVLDFIGNFKKANKIRQWLSKDIQKKHDVNNSFEKIEYTYNTKSSVSFDQHVEEILDGQDRNQVEYTKEELVGEYINVKLGLNGKRPTIDEFKKVSKIQIGAYVRAFGSWIKFLKSINELSESSSVYPQGVHWGHILYILSLVFNHAEKGTLIGPEYIMLSGNLSKNNEIAKKQRQTKYKILAMMEMGLLVDQRNKQNVSKLALTSFGKEFYNTFYDLIKCLELNTKENGTVSWTMNVSADTIVQKMKQYVNKNNDAKLSMEALLQKFPAAQQVMKIIYSDLKEQQEFSKNKLYTALYDSSVIDDYCNFMGVDAPSAEAWKHRAPFLIGILEILNILSTNRSNIMVPDFVVTDFMVKLKSDDNEKELQDRVHRTIHGRLTDKEILEFRIRYGKDFETDKFRYNSLRGI